MCRTTIGLKVKDGVVLAVEKPIHSRLLKAGANRRIHTVELHAGVVGAGLAADCRALALRAREESASHRENFATGIPGPMLADRLAMYVQAYTLYGSVRPFCGNLLMAAVDEDGSHLYMVEPSGVCWGYRGCAAGKGRQTAKTEIEKLDLDSMTVSQAVVEAAKIIYLAHDPAKDKDFELEMSWIGPESNNQHQIVPKEVLEAAIRVAKENLAARMDYD
ncbi:Proteasome subunit alpha type [Paramicrosporidium saccamoebae]|uniref:Proteasome subunit alpha type n=1 Tax=Paramicrosporidium saccamoebae TaxID=1246581 RepID=A0A2H9TMJ4_9FUNG|nr:Proteasome subunit alpha type [Paramicrosporidium saccamoebae]